MKPRHRPQPLLLSVTLLATTALATLADPSTPEVGLFSFVDGRVTLNITPPSPPLPAVQSYRVWRANAVAGPFSEEASQPDANLQWTGPAAGSHGFYRIEARQLSQEELHGINLLHRIAYGPTPDELERVLKMGPAAYIDEQLAPETISEHIEDTYVPPPPPPPPDANGWQLVSLTGIANKDNPDFYVYLSAPGEAYLDDIRFVAGPSNDLSKPNLLVNADFERGLAPEWTTSTNLEGSAITTLRKHGGSSSLHLVATAAGTTKASSIWQATTRITNGGEYTLSFFYQKGDNLLKPVLRVSGGTDDPEYGIYSARPPVPTPPGLSPAFYTLQSGEGTLQILRRWHLLNAIQSRRQLLEVMRQFWENHFVTQYSKVSDYLARFFGNDADINENREEIEAAELEFRENLKWREAMLNPNCTFHDLLRISAESASMIIYLDTVNSKGGVVAQNGTWPAAYLKSVNIKPTATQIDRIANENYARELCELFCFGVDNGYDQQDIIQISRAFTGWSVGYLLPQDANNPFGEDLTKRTNNPTDGDGNIIDNIGVWGFVYKARNHHQGPKYCFYETDANGNVDTTRSKKVPARFGPPWAGLDYGLTINGGLRETNTIQEAYEILSHMANQPFTEEYISVKLCRLLVHEHFAHGYDFTDAEASPEEKLVHDCMRAWEFPANGGPKGQIRDVLRTILASDLFKSHAAVAQKVKTPLEYAISTVRALRVALPDGTFTSDSNGDSLNGILSRAGSMNLFDRAEPDGYPEDGAAWISAGTLAERVRFVQSALSRRGENKSDAGASTLTDPVGLLRLKRPEALLNPEGMADFFLAILYPGEGTANLARYRDLAIQFLNTDDSGTKAAPLKNMDPTSVAYDQRVRGMVAMLMTTARFQEQ